MGIGSIDHHYAEYIVILAVIASSLAWMRRPNSTHTAAPAGAVLGAGPLMHNGLFVMQLIPLISAGILWLRGDALASKATFAFSLALIVSTVLAVLPSEPLWQGRFDFYLSFWFHFT